MMDLRTSMMIMLTENSGTTDIDFTVSGDLGADGGGQQDSADYQSGSLTGFMSTVCGAGGDPSINHLFVVDSSLSPHITHVVPDSTGTVIETVSGIGPGSPLLYLLYASTGASGCHSAEQHRAVFDAAVAALHPCGGTGGAGGEGERHCRSLRVCCHSTKD